MTFTGKIEGYEVEVHAWDGKVQFQCREIGTKEFDSLEQLERAITAYDLKLRKTFSNRTAYITRHRYANGNNAEKVEVTSTSDGEAWVRGAGNQRSKVSRDAIFSDRTALQSVIDQDLVADSRKERRWKDLARWEPIP